MIGANEIALTRPAPNQTIGHCEADLNSVAQIAHWKSRAVIETNDIALENISVGVGAGKLRDGDSGTIISRNHIADYEVGGAVDTHAMARQTSAGVRQRIVAGGIGADKVAFYCIVRSS